MNRIGKIAMNRIEHCKMKEYKNTQNMTMINQNDRLSGILNNVWRTFLLFVFMTVASVQTVFADTWDGTSVATSYAGGRGTEEDPYIISKADELVWFANQSNGKTYWVKLTADIDLGGNNWVNGTTTKYGSGKEFKGKFIADKKADGTNYTISNFKLNVPNAAGQYGLLSKVTGGIIRNIDVKDVTIHFFANITTAAYVGALVGSTSTNTVVENCHASNVTMNLKGITTNSGMGGLIGYFADKSTVTNCGSKDFTMTSTGAITVGGQGALIGSATGKAHTISNCTVDNANITVNAEYKGGSLGGMIGYCQGASATARASISDCTITNSTITATKLGATAYVGLVVGHNSTYVDVTNCSARGTESKHSAIKITGASAGGTGYVYLGGVIGRNQSYGKITGCTAEYVDIEIGGASTYTRIGGITGTLHSGSASINSVFKNNTADHVTIKTANMGSTGYIGGLAGLLDNYIQNSGNNVNNATINVNGNITATTYIGGAVACTGSYNELTNINVNTANITVTGLCTNANIGGLVGYVKGGAATKRTPVQRCTVTSARISVGGAGASTNYIGGLAGIATTHVNLFNNKVENPAIAITGAINGNSYFGGAVGNLATYTTIDGLYVNGGSITGPSASGTGVKNNVEFYVGGAVGRQQGGANAAATQQNQIRNVAVESLNINLGNYAPATGIMNNNKFSVGGVIGQTADVRSYKEECGIPENLISKNVKLYAPYAMTSPLVGGFGVPAYNTYTIDANTYNDDVQRSRVGSWMYSGYKLGLSPKLLETTNAYNAASANGKVKRNYSKALEIIDGVSYLPIDDETFLKYNRMYDVEYTCKTVLWWTRTDNNASYANNDIDQTIYPQSGLTTTGMLTDSKYPYTMYFYQGVNHGTSITDAGATALINGIAGRIAYANDAASVTLTISDPSEKVRGFGEHTISVAASDETGISYQWYVDGVASGTGSSITVKPDWRFGKGIVVNASKDGSIVASASYTLKHGVLKTKNSDNVETDYVGMPTTQRGTEANPYIIDCPEALRQFSWLSTYCNSFYWETLEKQNGTSSSYQSAYHFNRAYYELSNDIDLKTGTDASGKPILGDFTPISHTGTSNSATQGTYNQNSIFSGHFDGKGFAIKNFKVTWRGGIRNADSNNYYGLFGAVGWGALSTTETCVIQNLVIDNAQLVHDTNNTSFSYNNGVNSTVKNNVQLGILAGIVTARTTIQNVEVRNSKITDENDTQTYNMAGKWLAVGGMIGRVHNKIDYNSKEGDLANSVTLQFLSSNCDISLTHAAFDGTSLGNPTRLFSVGGVVGTLITSAAFSSINMPQYTYFTGKVDAQRALVGPCFGSLEYNGNSGTGYNVYWNNYMAKTTNATQEIPNMYFGDYQIQTYTSSGKSDLKTITNDYPAVGCSDGSRTITPHNGSHPSNTTFYTEDNYYGEYQGVNYGECINTDGQKTNIEVDFEEKMNDAGIEGYYLIFTGNQMQMMKTKPLKVSILDNTTDATATNHNLQVISNQGTEGYTFKWYVNGKLLDGVTSTTYTAPIGTTPQLIYVVATKDGEEGVTTEAIALPRNINSFNATYSPSSKSELVNGAFDGVFTVTPDAAFTDEDSGFSISYDWKEWKLDDEGVDYSWGDLSDGTTTQNNRVNSTTSGAFFETQYQCTVTAVDDQWAAFLESIATDDHYTEEQKNMYPASFSKVLFVKFRASKVIFLHPTQQAETFDYVTVPAGKDSYTSEELGDGEIGDVDHPVKTWGKAYSLLDEGENITWDDNTIVLVGTSTGVQTWGVNGDGTRCTQPQEVSEFGLSNLFATGTVTSEIDALRYDQYIAKIAASPMDKNVTITGQYVGIDYHAVIKSPLIGTTTNKIFLNFYGNTKFEHLTFYGGAREYDVIMGHYHDLWFGEGLIMKNFNIDDKSYGTMSGLASPRFQIFGGMHMDKRFNSYYDAADGLLDEMLQKSMPNGEKGFTLTFRSGFYSMICSGSRQTGNAGMQGSPNMPIKCTIDVDLDQKWNIAHQMGTISNSGKTGPDETLCTPYDIALILAGNHEGPMYGDVDIKVKSGRIGRIVNGSLGALRAATYKYKGSTKNYPMNTYIGRANILLDPASSRFAQVSEKNAPTEATDKRVIVTELYNGGVGRALGSDGEINMPTLSKNTVLMKGGTIGFPDKPNVDFWSTDKWNTFISNPQIICGMYGGGAGGMNGIGYGEAGAQTHVAYNASHPDDEVYSALLPYWEDTQRKEFAFGNYATYITKTGDNHLTVKCYNADTQDYTYFDPLDTSSEITIEGGKIGTATSPASIFGAGSGFTSTQFLSNDKDSYPNTKAGNMYGRSKDAVVATINIKGGTVYGNVYGAGKGTDYYYTTLRSSGTPANYTDLGQTYGSVITNITGGTINGNVYGAGAGVAEAMLAKAKTTTYGQLTETALLSGDATVNIGGDAQIKSYTNGGMTYGGNVYGGGMLAKVEGNTNVNVSGTAQIEGDVFGAAQGITNTTATTKQNISGTAETYLLTTADNSKLFGKVMGNSTVTTSETPHIMSDIYGGAESAISSRTFVNINGTPLLGDAEGNGGNIFGGGLGALNATGTAVIASADVTDNTLVTINGIIDYANKATQYYIYGGGNVASSIAVSSNVVANAASADQSTIFGAGYGVNTSSPVASVKVNNFASTEGKAADGTKVYYGIRNVYGGGNQGVVFNSTTVDINGGVVFGNVLGGGNIAEVGRGNEGDGTTVTLDGAKAHVYGNIVGGGNMANVNGQTVVNLNKGYFAADVFGGGNGLIDGTKVYSADVTGNSNININGASAEWNTKWIPAVFNEDGKQTSKGHYYTWIDAQSDGWIIEDYIGTHNVYGGANTAGAIKGSTFIVARKGFCDSGLLSNNSWRTIYADTGKPCFSILGGGYGEKTNVAGDTDIDVDFTSGGSKTLIKRFSAAGYSRFYAGQAALDIYGGGFNGPVAGSTNVKVDGNTFLRRVMGGGYYADVNNTNVLVQKGDIDDVFAGGLIGNVKTDATVSIGEKITDSADASKNKQIYINQDVYGGNDVSGVVAGKTTVNAFGGMINGNIYGAGNGNYLYTINPDIKTVTRTYNYDYTDGKGSASLVYQVPVNSDIISDYASATSLQKLVNINNARPLVANTTLNLGGYSSSNRLNVNGAIYGGGNTATVGTTSGKKPSVKFNIGSHIKAVSIFMGCDGSSIFDNALNKSQVNVGEKGFDYNAFVGINNFDMGTPIDWTSADASAIEDIYFGVSSANRPKVYKHLLDMYFRPVEMNIQPTLAWNYGGETTADVYVGSFFCGADRGSMTVEPTNGKIVNYTLPTGMVIYDKIVGGCNNSNAEIEGVKHEGGYLLGQRGGDTEINLIVKSKFYTSSLASAPTERQSKVEGRNVFGGCYNSGVVNGDIKIVFRSDMLTKANGFNHIAAINDDAHVGAGAVAVGRIYGAGYGKESTVNGNTEVVLGDAQYASKNYKANYVYGGGHNGTLVGNSTVRIANGTVKKSVLGGCYAGYQYGSSQVIIGSPSYYVANNTGEYNVKRADVWNADMKNEDDTYAIKKSIFLMAGDIVSTEVYDAICAYDATKASEFTFTDETKDEWYSATDINIGDAVYGGGYRTGSASGGIDAYMVKKYNDEYNLGEGTKGYGGNTTVVLQDRFDGNVSKIKISLQDYNEAVLEEGDNLEGRSLFVKDENGDLKPYEVTAGEKYSEAVHGEITFYEVGANEADGGIFGDGHDSFAEGFRSGNIVGYGFVNVKNGKKKALELHSLQRMDMVRVEDCCMNLFGAKDYTVNNDQTNIPYSIVRVDELHMIANRVVYHSSGKLNLSSARKSRNYIATNNNVRYCGAIVSNVNFDDKYRDFNGVQSATKTYYERKNELVQVPDNKLNSFFKERNNATAANMIGINSGYALRVQNYTENNDGSENMFYGPIVGVVEIDLISLKSEEGGGFAYADNIHRENSFLETSGNFVFPCDGSNGSKYVVDDCFPTGYVDTHSDTGEATEEIHYWYIDASEYYYHAEITAINYNSASKPGVFTFDNSLGDVSLTGVKTGNKLVIKSLTWVTDTTTYSSPAEKAALLAWKADYLNTVGTPSKETGWGNNDDANYKLYMCLSASLANSNHKETDTHTGWMNLPLSSNWQEKAGGYTDMTSSCARPRVCFKYEDMADNGGTAYFDKFLSHPSMATIEIVEENTGVPDSYILLKDNIYKKSGDSYVKIQSKNNLNNGTQYYYRDGLGYFQPLVFGTDDETDNVYTRSTASASDAYEHVPNANYIKQNSEAEVFYKGVQYKTHIIYLRIGYSNGPDLAGKIKVENCAMPGEYIKVSYSDVLNESPLVPTRFLWKIGPKSWDETKAQWVLDESKALTYVDGDEASTSPELRGDVVTSGENYILLPAYYYMNGYGVQYGCNYKKTENNFFAVPYSDADTLVVHNYHRMLPKNVTGSYDFKNYKIEKAVQRAKSEKGFAEPRIYIEDAAELNEFASYVAASGSNYGANMQFFIQKNILMNADYAVPAKFSGTLNGDGHVITAASGKTSIVKNNAGKIYNLGAVKFTNIATANAAGALMSNCYIYGTASATRVAGSNKGTIDNCFTNKATTITGEKQVSESDMRYGKLAFYLNQYYVDKLADSDSKSSYLDQYYYNGDYQYARILDGKEYPEMLRLGEPYYYTLLTGDQKLDAGHNAKTNHNADHDVDVLRAIDYHPASTHEATAEDVANGLASYEGDIVVDVPVSYSHYEPVYNREEGAINDYILFGQKFVTSTTANAANAALGTVNTTVPSCIDNRQVSLMSNRVFKTVGYYGNKQEDEFFFNANTNEIGNAHVGTYVLNPALTAVDFTEGDRPNGYYSFGVASDVYPSSTLTKNLLVYTDTEDAVNAQCTEKVSDRLKYSEATLESAIRGHHVVISNSGDAEAAMLHLVDKETFNAPIEFNVKGKAWYVRNPQTETGYVEAAGQAWESICLPFSPNAATLSQGIQMYNPANGAKAKLLKNIDFFYGADNTSEDPANSDYITTQTENNNVGHQFWLRSLNAVSGDKAQFKRPDTSLADGGFEAYKPYIVSFPGSLFYEFDMTGQSVEFSKNADAVVAVTDDCVIPQSTDAGSYGYYGAFSTHAASASLLAIDIEGADRKGDRFEASKNIYAFRAYLSATDPDLNYAKSREVIYISDDIKDEMMERNDAFDEEGEEDDAHYLKISINNGIIIVESNYETDLRVHTIAGQYVATLHVDEGRNTYSKFSKGIYLIGDKKFVIR